MGFLSPVMLLFGAALAVPLWLHMRRKRRQPAVEFPSLRYLKLAQVRMRRQARVEDWVLLGLRLCLVGLLVAAFARPVVHWQGGGFGAGRDVETVVVIDATASMGWRGADGSRLERAKILAREWVEGLDKSNAVALWVLTDRLEMRMPVAVTDRRQWQRELERVGESEGASSWAPVFEAAREWAGRPGVARKELILIGDQQVASWDWAAESFFRHSWKRARVDLTVLAVDALKPANVSVKSVEWQGRGLREGGVLTGVAKISNQSDEAVRELLECRVGEQVIFRKALELKAGEIQDVPLSVVGTAAAGGREPMVSGELALLGDGLAADNRWYFALPVRRPLHSLVVGGEGGAGGGFAASFFLNKALVAGGAGRAEIVAPAAWSQQSTLGLDSIWFTGAMALGQAEWEKARKFAEEGGTVVVTGDCQPEPLPEGWPVTAGEKMELPVGRIATRILVSSHPLFDGVWGDAMPFPPVPQRLARNCVAENGANVLVTLAGGFPFLVELPRGKGRVLWLNASADRAWGDLPLSPVYVALVQQMARAGGLALEVTGSRWVGESWPDLRKFSNDVAWKAVDSEIIGRITRSGIYDAVSKDGQKIWRCAANVRREESDLRPVDAEKLRKFLPGQLVIGAEGMGERRKESQQEVPLWPWLLLLAAGVYLWEGRMSAAAARRRRAAVPASFPAVKMKKGRRLA